MSAYSAILRGSPPSLRGSMWTRRQGARRVVVHDALKYHPHVGLYTSYTQIDGTSKASWPITADPYPTPCHPSRTGCSLTRLALFNPWLQTWAAVLSCNVLCRLGFNTRSQCRAEGAPLARRRRAVNGHERRRRECAAVHKERQLHGQRYARSEVSTGFMATGGVS